MGNRVSITKRGSLPNIYTYVSGVATECGVPKQEATYRRPKRETEATAWRHSLSDIARPYDKLRNNKKDKKKRPSLTGGKHETEI